MSAVRWYGAEAKKAMRSALAGGLLAVAEELQDRSLRIVPRETSELAASCVADVDADGLVAAVSYNPASRPIYAIIQHEALSYHHPAGESAKYLEKPLRSMRGSAGNTLAARVRGAL